MAERTNPHANLIIGAQDEATPVFDKIKASSQNMAAGVEQAATKAAGAMGGIGDKAAPAAQKLDGVTASMIRQVQRLNAELEAGSARNAAYFEKMANLKGADTAALAPYLAQLKQAEAAQRIATTGLDQMGMSAKQTSAALRQVPMQFTDIVVSLQGGQSAMQVFMQQGGQLKDLFGGIGPAARAMGGYVAGLVTPFTLAAAAIASIAVAYKQGSAEADGYRMALVMTGNAAGTTAAQMQQMAGRISSVVGTQGAAAEALAQMASSGRVASQSLEYFSEVAIKFERATGTAISETVKRFAELGASPVDASRKLNEETNYLTASIYEQIKALKDQGREADAAALAQNTYADALNNRSAQITQNLGAIEGAWKAIKDAAKSGWDAMLNVGRADSLGTQIDNMRAKIAQAKGQDKNRPFSMPWDTSLADLEKQLSYLTEQERLVRRGAEAQAQRTQAEKEAIAATDALQKTQTSGLTNQQKMNKALEEYARHIEKLKVTNPASALLSPDAIARGEKAIRDQFSDKGKGSAGINAANKELADQAKLLAELNGLTGSFAKEWDTLSAVYAKGGMSLEQLTSAQAKLLAKQPAIKAAADEQAKAQQVLAKANLDAAASREKYIASLATGLDKIQAEIVAQEEATARMGLSKEAIADLDAAKLDMMATDLELQAIKAMDRNLDEQTYDALKQQAQAYRDLAKAKQAGAAKEVAVDAAKKAADEWQRTSEQINSTLTDALMRGFESGKDFAKNLRDTVVNMFKTLVLRPVVSALVSPISGALLGGLGLAGSAAASQGGAGSGVSTALSGASLLGSVGGSLAAGAGWMTGATTLGGSLSAGMSLLGTGSLAGAGAGLGMLAGALGPIALGIGLLSSAFSRKLKDQGIQGTLGGEAGFEGQQYRFYKGGLFRSDKTTYSAVDPELARMLAGGFSAVQDQVTDFAEALSLPTDRIKGFTTDIKVSFNGLDEAGIQKALQDALATGSNELAQQVLGTLTTTTREVTETLAGGMGDWGDGTMQTVTRTIEETTYAASEFARDGEQAIDTLTRLATSLYTVNDIWKNLGYTVYEASLAGADAASKMADAFGGLEAMAAATGAYFENFYSAEEQRAAVERQLNEALGKLNLQLPDIDATDARAQYRALAEAQDRNTEAGREAYVVLLQLSGAFASVTAESETAAAAAARLADEQRKVAEDAARAAEEAARRAEEIARERYGLETQLMQLLGDTAGLRKREIEALDASNRALQEHIYAIEDARAAYEKSITAAQSAYSVLESSVGRDRSALQSALDAERDAINARYKLQQDGHAAQLSAAQSAADKMRGIASMLSGALGRMVVESPALDRARLQSARGVIGAAAASSNVMAPGLEAALSVVTDDVRKLYGKWDDFAFDQGVTAGQTAALSSAAKSQLSGYESIVNALRAQDDVTKLLADAELAAAQERFEIESKKLDERIEQGKSMLDRLLGIEEGTLSSVEALARLTDAVNAGNAALQAQRAAEAAARMAVMQGGGGGGGGGVTQGAAVGNKYTDADLIAMGFNLSDLLAYTQLSQQSGVRGGLDSVVDNILRQGDDALRSAYGLQYIPNRVGPYGDVYTTLTDKYGKTYESGSDWTNMFTHAQRAAASEAWTNSAAGNGINPQELQTILQIGSTADRQLYWAGGSLDMGGFSAQDGQHYSSAAIVGAINTVLGQGASVQDVLNAGQANFGLDAEDIRTAARAAGIPGFATGINRVPHDMLARIHKDEAVVPAAYNPYNPSASVPGNSEVVAELRKLNERIARIEASSNATAGHTAGTDRKLARVIRNDAMITEALPA